MKVLRLSALMKSLVAIATAAFISEGALGEEADRLRKLLLPDGRVFVVPTPADVQSQIPDESQAVLQALQEPLLTDQPTSGDLRLLGVSRKGFVRDLEAVGIR